MRKFYILPFTVLFTVWLNAQNVVVNPGAGSYPSLETAFASINAGTHTGAITIDIIANTTELFPAFLNASGVGPASYTSVLIRPSGGAPRTISGAMPPGLPLIELNGADNVTIDGLNAGGNSLIIRNTTVSPNAGTSTITILGGGTNNTITRSTVEGSFSGPTPTNGGIIYFGTDLVTAGGNDNNTISFNDFGPAGVNLPSIGVSSFGTTATTANNNSGLIINNNNFGDIFAPAFNSSAVLLDLGSTDITVSNNRFFQTAPRTFTAAVQHTDIWINNTSGNNFQILNNISGFNSSAGTGTSVFNFTGPSRRFAILINAGATFATTVQGNTVEGTAISGTGSGTGANAPFTGILVNNGLVDILGNNVGSQTATNSITYTSSSSSASDVTAIYNGGGNNNVLINNNLVGGITAGNSSTGAINLFGIRNNNPTAILTATNNTVGGTVPNSIQSTSSAFGSKITGLSSNASSTTVLDSRFRLYHLFGPGTVTGMEVNGGSGDDLVARNFIYLLGTGNNGTLNGIVVNNGTGTAIYRNNMIDLGLDGAGNPIITTVFIHGIQHLGGAARFYFNSVYIAGTGVIGNANSAAFRGTIASGTREYLNNILVNARSNSTGLGTHWSIIDGGTVSNPPGLISDHNVLFTTGSGGATGFFNGITRPTLASWRAATGHDNNSIAGDPQFVNPTGNASTVNLHIHPSNPTVVEGTGLFIGTVTDDFDGQSRPALTPTDIGADAGNFVSIFTLPVSLLNFSGYKQETVNILRWTTVNEFNTLGFEVQSSNDGLTYNPIGFVNTLAPGGNSNAMLNYTFTDNNRSFKQYYRLRQVDIDNRSKFSTIVLIRNDKPVLLAIKDLFPNPANSIVNVIIEAPLRNDVSLVVTDMSGRIVIQKAANVDIGSNTMPIDVSKLIKGSYMVKLVCPGCYPDETGVSKFVKQ